MSCDMRHVLKRTTRMFLNKGITIDGVHPTPDVFVGLGKTMKLGYADALSAALQRPDFMSVPDALIVLMAMVSCGSVEDGWHMDQLDPSRRKQHSAMRKMHFFLKHAHAYYFENTHTLLTRLKHAATASDHLFDLQVLFAPFDPALYYDWQLELCGVFTEVEIFQREFPGEPFFICHRGNDRLEGTFSVCRMGRGSGGCLDIIQLRYRLAIVVQMSAIYAKHPKWKAIRKRAATGDNITPTTAGSCTYVIDCTAAVWNAELDMANAELKKDLRAMVVGGVGIFSPFGVPMEIGTMDNAEVIPDDPEDLLECDEEDELEQSFTNDSTIFFEGKLTSKQQVLNKLINTPADSAPQDSLMRALQMPRPGTLPTLTVTPQAENMPMAGDTFAACVCFQEDQLGLGIFSLQAATNSSGHSAMDTPTSEIEGAAHLTIHGQFMPLERYASAGLHVWHDRLHALAMSFLGTSVQFIRLQVNEDNKWYAPTSQLDALSQWCAQSAPQKVPPLKCEPYEGLFVTDRGDKGLTTDISRSVQCKICEAIVPRVCIRTHVGQHLPRKECVKSQQEISLATACGFCGDRITCSTQVVMRNKRTHALVTVMISDCPSQPAKLRWNTLAKKSASSPCTNHPLRCPLCTKAVWS